MKLNRIWPHYTAGVIVILLLSIQPIAAEDSEQDVDEIWSRMIVASRQEKDAEAVKLLDAYLKAGGTSPHAEYLRGVHLFRLQEFKQSVAAFDRYVILRPEAERKLWERGISHYYAEMYKEGAEQFALYQTYHDNDVENSVWRFICMAKTDGVEKARKEMLPIRNDPRIPLMEAYALFRGESTPEKVLEVAKQGNPEAEVLAGRMFYAQLYLALYYDAIGEKVKALDYATQAWKDHESTQQISRYMWQVAKVHAQTLSAKKKSVKQQ